MPKKKERVAKVAKAGRRARPPETGSFRTTQEERRRGRWLASLGFTSYFPPLYPAGR